MSPFWDRAGGHDIYRRWRRLLAEYGPDRTLAAAAWVMPLAKMADFVRPDGMHRAFDFGYRMTPGSADTLREIITESLTAFHRVGAPATWVLSNHDAIWHTTRLALGGSMDNHLDGLGPRSPFIPDEARVDPTFRRTNKNSYGRAGCRVPIPWKTDSPTFGFAPAAAPGCRSRQFSVTWQETSKKTTPSYRCRSRVTSSR